MFRKTRHKIVLTIMLILVLLFLGTLAVIYGSSYYDVSGSNLEMLKRYAELYSLEAQPGDMGQPDDGPKTQRDRPPTEEPAFENSAAFRLSTFYSVALSTEGEVLATDNDMTVYGDDELASLAAEAAASGKSQGIKGHLIFITADKGGYTLVAFMDNTIIQESMTTLFRYTLIFGSAAIVLFFFLSVYLARWIIRPLEESHRRQVQFISDAGHELKTPVSVISANAELLSRENGENPWLANIQYENEKMGTLVTQLLELARTESAAPKMELLDLSRLTAGETLPFESVAFENGIILRCDIEEDIQMTGDSGRLTQLISILLDNAVCHCPEGGEVKLELKQEKNAVLLSVTNDGEAIPPEQIGHIFERFYRVDSTRNSEDGHYGLGLAIARAIALAHRSRISVRCPDGKVEFTVRIPLK